MSLRKRKIRIVVPLLALAVERDNSAVVAALLARGAKGVDEQTSFREMALDWDDQSLPTARLPLLLGAARAGNVEIVKSLLDHGAKIDVTG